jgi:purine-binding chemotaxis protein CheW
MTPSASANSGDLASPHAHEDLLQLVGFRLGKEEYGLDILCVQEIIRSRHLTRVPNSPPFVQGVINLRGRVIPVIALRKCFGLEMQAEGGENRIVVVEAKGMVVGFLVDAVSEVLRIPVDSVEPPPRLTKAECNCVSSLSKLDDRMLIVLDIDRLMQEQVIGPLSGNPHPGSR